MQNCGLSKPIYAWDEMGKTKMRPNLGHISASLLIDFFGKHLLPRSVNRMGVVS